ncbi:hypothetical protein IHE45_09G013900 [Dioscorea alata]|uniref:Uncharacterized protein n=1 Tax=Dioscorea alata TaxID=55571 RepID=A0ACB7VDJ1_DIOAL|nr:hypothetical protein IHE45_09G013900 [Dioscorea alata]
MHQYHSTNPQHILIFDVWIVTDQMKVSGIIVGVIFCCLAFICTYRVTGLKCEAAKVNECVRMLGCKQNLCQTQCKPSKPPVQLPPRA